MEWYHTPQRDLIYELVRHNGTWQMHLIADNSPRRRIVPLPKYRDLHINHLEFSWTQANLFAINCGWRRVTTEQACAMRAYDPMTERTSDQTNETLARYISEHLNEHNIPLPPNQVYLIAEALAQGAYEAMRTLIERLS